MSDSILKLNDKTAVLAGPFSLCLQNITAKLAELGADVAVITDDVKAASRFCQNLMDLREVSEKYGRAVVVEGADISDAKAAENCFSRSAEIFGTTDIYIDLNLFGVKIPFLAETTPPRLNDEFGKAYRNLQFMTAAAAKFIKSRNRGRLLFLMHELDMISAEKFQFTGFHQAIEYLRTTAKELATGPNHTAFNALAVGVNEEYLVTRFPKSPSMQKALIELQKVIPQARLVDHNEISALVCFLISSASSGINGQVIHLNHGI